MSEYFPCIGGILKSIEFRDNLYQRVTKLSKALPIINLWEIIWKYK